jgi:anion-transporting  ArsA/GET3 family ATPase
MDGLFSRTIVFVTGKGGVGKTTIAAVVARAFEARGKRTLLTTAGTAEGEAALAEYLGLHLPATLVGPLTRSGVYRRFVNGAPALRELMIVGKIADDARSGFYDAVVVDMPATGHAIEMLRMPGAAVTAFGGLVRSESSRILEQLLDPARATVCLVTTAEELPVRETLEASEDIRELRVGVGAVVVNRMRRAPLAAAEVPDPAGHPPRVAAALRCAREEASWAELNRRWLDTLRAGLDTTIPIAVLPRLAADPLGPAELDELRDLLGAS